MSDEYYKGKFKLNAFNIILNFIQEHRFVTTNLSPEQIKEWLWLHIGEEAATKFITGVIDFWVEVLKAIPRQ